MSKPNTETRPFSVLLAQKPLPRERYNQLRHSNSRTTLDIYSHAKDNSKLAAQGEMLAAIFLQQPGAPVN